MAPKGMAWIEVLGFETLSVRLLTSILTAPLAVGAGIYEEAKGTLEATLPFVPTQTGALRDSGRVDPPVVRPSYVSVDILFGNSQVDYAVPVHENTDAHHAPPTKAKFLEDVVLARANSMQARIGFTTARILKI